MKKLSTILTSITLGILLAFSLPVQGAEAKAKAKKPAAAKHAKAVKPVDGKAPVKK